MYYSFIVTFPKKVVTDNQQRKKGTLLAQIRKISIITALDLCSGISEMCIDESVSDTFHNKNVDTGRFNSK